MLTIGNPVLDDQPMQIATPAPAAMSASAAAVPAAAGIVCPVASSIPAVAAPVGPASVPSAAAAAAAAAVLRPPVPPPRAARSQKRARPLPAGSGNHWTFTPATSVNPPLRHVRPYHHEYGVFVKARWVGRSVLDVLVSDFKPPAGVLPNDEEEGEEHAPLAASAAGASSHSDATGSSAAAAAASPLSPAEAAASAYYRRAISLGFVLLNDAPTRPEVLLRNGDHLRQRVHRHEPPVLDHDPSSGDHRIRILHADAQVVVVDKAPSIPVHESGVLRAQSLLAILYAQPGPTQGIQLFPVHRLDKLTSGCVILARSAQVAKQLGRIIQFKGEDSDAEATATTAAAAAAAAATPIAAEATHVEEGSSVVASLGAAQTNSFSGAAAAASAGAASVASAPSASASSSSFPRPVIQQPGGLITKLYLARCAGLFPSAHALSRMTLESDGRYRVSAPLYQLGDVRRGTRVVDFARGQSAVSIVRLLSYDAASHSSVVEVQPLTGRTHQIRMHLQWLGHPIVNDYLYGAGLFRGNSYASLCAHPDEAVAQRAEVAWADGCLDCLASKYYSPENESAPNLRYATHIYLHALSYSFVPPPPQPTTTATSTAAAGAATAAPPPLNGIAAGFNFTTERPAWAAPDFDVLKDLGERVQSAPRAADVLLAEQQHH